jgi:hypothetical protein
MAQTSSVTFVTVDGWTTPFPEADLRFFLQPPPRPYGYYDQLRKEVRSWWAWVRWVSAAGLIALGAALGPWSYGLFGPTPLARGITIAGWVIGGAGGWVLASYLDRLIGAMKAHRTAPLLTGVIQDLEPIPSKKP